MFCSLCWKSATTLITHNLCECCSQRLKYNKAATREKTSASLVPDDHAIRQDILQQQQQQLHEDLCCPVRIVFRCTICDGDYLDKAVLDRHLDQQHGVLAEFKELHCQERKVSYDIHQCALCNDQRGYQETLYWKHVHEEHDGFFLRCSDCDENFRSQKLKTDHDQNHCKTREQAVPSSMTGPEKDPESESSTDFIKVEPLEIDDSDIGAEASTSYTPSLNQIPISVGSNFSDYFSATRCHECHKECNNNMILINHIKRYHPENVCDVCEKSFNGKNQVANHKLKSHPSPTDGHLDVPKNASVAIEKENSTDQISAEQLPGGELPGDNQGQPASDPPAQKDNDTRPKKRKRIRRPKQEVYGQEDCEWKVHGIVPVQEVDTYLAKLEHGFSIRTRNMPHPQGQKSDYRCQRLKVDGPQCGRKVMVFVPRENETEAIINVRGRHTCFDVPLDRLSRETLRKLDQSFQDSRTQLSCPQESEAKDKSTLDNNIIHKLNMYEYKYHTTLPVEKVDSYLQSLEYGFKLRAQRQTDHGRTRIYNCNRLKTKVPCGRRVMVFIANGDTTKAVLSTRGSHTCLNAPLSDLSREALNKHHQLSDQTFQVGNRMDVDQTDQTVGTLQGEASANESPLQQQSGNESIENWGIFFTSRDYEMHSTIPVEQISSYVLTIEYGFRLKNISNTSAGTVKFFYCRRIKSSGALQCDRKLLICIPTSGAKDAIVGIRGNHTCLTVPVTRLSPFGLKTVGSANEVLPLSVENNCRKSDDSYQLHSTIPVDQISSHVQSIEFGFILRQKLKKSKGSVCYYNCQRMKARVQPPCDRKVQVCIPEADGEQAIVSIRGRHTCLTAPLTSLRRATLQQLNASEAVSSLPKDSMNSNESDVITKEQASKETDVVVAEKDVSKENPSLAQPELPLFTGTSGGTSTETNEPMTSEDRPGDKTLQSPSTKASEKARKTSKRRPYEHHSTVPVDQIDSHVLTIEYGFRRYQLGKMNKGTVRYYTCRRIKFAASPQCERKLNVNIPKGNEKIAIVSIRGKHTCLTAPAKHLSPSAEISESITMMRKKKRSKRISNKRKM